MIAVVLADIGPLGAVLRVLAALAMAAAVTVLSLRLLGIRRGWGTALVSGAVGWAVATLLALGLTGWDRGADGLVTLALAIGIPATMATAVTLDLLSRPGSLALGERAGLFVTPRPVKAIRRRLAVIRRYHELVRLLRREGFAPYLPIAGRVDPVGAPVGVRLRRVLEEAGGLYIKLGQIAATRIDLVPAEIADELARLQNQAAPEPKENVVAVLEAELAGEVDQVFAEFEWEPLAAASIGQTHRARLHSGAAVVVKVQRLGIEDAMERDLAALALLADVAQRRTVMGQGIRSGEMLGQFAHSLRAELDFRREVDAMEEMALLLGEDSEVRVPEVHRELCTRRLLVQERFDGFALADTEQLTDSGVDRRALAEQLLRSFLDQVLRSGFFHADPHPGNVFAFHDGSLGLIDFGAVGRLDPIEQAAVVDILVALARRDVSLLRDGIERVADVTEVGASDQLERALARLMAEHLRATGTVDPGVLEDLVTTLTRFGVRLPGDLVTLTRALAILDGTMRVLDPSLSMVAAATEMMTSTTAPKPIDPEAMVRRELEATLPHLRRLPERIDRVLTLAGRGELRLRSIVDEDQHRIVRTLANRALLSAVGAAFLFASVLLLVAEDPGPTLATSSGLFEIFGFGGLFAGTVLLLRVVAAVARDGTT